MKNKLHWKPSSLLAPVPAVMVSCGTLEKANIITVGWCGVLSTRPPRLYVSIRPERHSYGIIDSTASSSSTLHPRPSSKSLTIAAQSPEKRSIKPRKPVSHSPHPKKSTRLPSKTAPWRSSAKFSIRSNPARMTFLWRISSPSPSMRICSITQANSTSSARVFSSTHTANILI